MCYTWEMFIGDCSEQVTCTATVVLSHPSEILHSKGRYRILLLVELAKSISEAGTGMERGLLLFLLFM